MKVINFIFTCMIVALASICVTSCSKDYSSPLNGQVVKDLTFESSKSSNSFSIGGIDLSGFTYSSSESWCTAVAYGTNLTVTVQDNDTYEDRKATVTIKDPEDQTTILFNVLQKQNDAIKIDGSAYTVPEEGGNVSIKVQSNVNYEVEIPESASWLKVSTRAATRGLTSSTIDLTADKNNSGDVREATVKVTDSNSKVSSQFTVKQELTPYITIDKEVLDMDELGGEVDITVTSNIAVDVQFSEDWISSAGITENGDFNFVQKIKVYPFANNGEDKRSATITFKDKLGKWNLSQVATVNETQSLLLKNQEVDILLEKAQTMNVVNRTGQSLSWTSSDTSIASVDNNGIVTGKVVGTATITVTTADGKHRAKCKVTVKNIIGFIQVEETGVSGSFTDGYIHPGSSLRWKFSNNSPETVILKEMKLCDAKVYFSYVLDINTPVSPGSSETYKITLGSIGLNAPVKCICTFEYNGRIYEAEGVSHLR